MSSAHTPIATHYIVRESSKEGMKGGKTEGQTNEIALYNIAASTWSTVTGTLATGRSNAACVVRKDKLYVIGGQGTVRSRL